MGEYGEFQPWFPGGDGDFCRGLYAPPNADPVEVLSAFLWEMEGVEARELTVDERDRLLSHVSFLPLRSVVKADYDDVGEDCEWHTDGSGKRSRDTWWLDNQAREMVDDVCDRLHLAAPNQVGGQGGEPS